MCVENLCIRRILDALHFYGGNFKTLVIVNVICGNVDDEPQKIPYTFQGIMKRVGGKNGYISKNDIGLDALSQKCTQKLHHSCEMICKEEEDENEAESKEEEAMKDGVDVNEKKNEREPEVGVKQ